MGNNKLKILLIISDIDKSLGFEWTVSGLNSQTNLICILIANANTSFQTYLATHKIVYKHLDGTAGPLRLWWQLFQIIKSEKPDVVHCHLWRATTLGLSTSWLLGVKKRIFTRHHALVHYREFPSGRKWDLITNMLATDIIAVSKNIENILVQRDVADKKKITLIHHGFLFGYFTNVSRERISAVKRKLNIQSAGPTIGVIARYVEWKGIEVVIDAFVNLLKDYPEAHLVLANAHGPHRGPIEASLKVLPKSSFTEITFEEDLAALYRIFTIYVHAPIDEESEAFGQTYVEALGSGVPSVFTLSGVASEFIRDGENALVVPFNNAEAILEKMKLLLESPKLQQRISEQGVASVGRFSIDKMVSALMELYGR
jgi:glycosyltransferase involved in cell wall biosynthesis